MDLFYIFIYLFTFGVLGIFTLCSFMLINTNAYPTIKEYNSEFYYVDKQSKEKKKFSSLRDYPSCHLSIIVPAYNEEKRLPPMLDEALEYLESRSQISSFKYEVIIVDDGSVDSTTRIGIEYGEKYGFDKIKVLTLEHNRGKGGAVRLGMLRAEGEILLFADADGATTFSDITKLEKSLSNLCKDSNSICDGLALVCGSRAHLEEESVAHRSFFRTVLMYGFHFIVWLLAVKSIRDTQCGFKLMTRKTARVIFGSLHVERWAFDVEMLSIAESLSIPIDEVAVKWTEIDGSKVTPVYSWIEMGLDIVVIWLKYSTGAWRIRADLPSKSD